MSKDIDYKEEFYSSTSQPGGSINLLQYLPRYV